MCYTLLRAHAQQCTLQTQLSQMYAPRTDTSVHGFGVRVRVHDQLPGALGCRMNMCLFGGTEQYTVCRLSARNACRLVVGDKNHQEYKWGGSSPFCGGNVEKGTMCVRSTHVHTFGWNLPA